MRLQWLASLTWAVASLPARAMSACEATVDADDALRFSQVGITLPAACTEASITLRHTGSPERAVTAHNWVLAREADQAAVIADGLLAGRKQGYVRPDDHRVIAHIRLIDAGERASTRFSTGSLRAGESYVYFCSYPGHGELQRGLFMLEPPAPVRSPASNAVAPPVHEGRRQSTWRYGVETGVRAR